MPSCRMRSRLVKYFIRLSVLVYKATYRPNKRHFARHLRSLPSGSWRLRPLGAAGSAAAGCVAGEGPGERAKGQGKRTSRPPIPSATKKQIAKLAREGKSINQIRKDLGIGYSTAYTYVQEGH